MSDATDHSGVAWFVVLGHEDSVEGDGGLYATKRRAEQAADDIRRADWNGDGRWIDVQRTEIIGGSIVPDTAPGGEQS